jgi:integrase
MTFATPSGVSQSRTASLVYVRNQMGHSSIGVTTDIYGHLIPRANVNAVDHLDAQTTPQESATQT